MTPAQTSPVAASGSASAIGQILQPGQGPIDGDHYLPAGPDTVSWGGCRAGPTRRCCGSHRVRASPSTPSVTRESWRTRARTLTYFTGHGVPADQVLSDAIAIAAELARDPIADGPHVVTGPILVEGPGPVTCSRSPWSGCCRGCRTA